MNQADREYELKVLKMTINTYLDKTVLVTEEGLKSLEANRDYVVWDLATKIYSQSGYKVEFSIVRDEVISRIRVMKAQLEAEVTRRVAEEKARQVEEEARLRAQIPHILEELAGDKDKARVFVRVRKIVSKELSVDENKVNLDSHLSNDLGADIYDLHQLLIALEEEFDAVLQNTISGVASKKSILLDGYDRYRICQATQLPSWSAGEGLVAEKSVGDVFQC
jgi:acyl carrier protein